MLIGVFAFAVIAVDGGMSDAEFRKIEGFDD